MCWQSNLDYRSPPEKPQLNPVNQRQTLRPRAQNAWNGPAERFFDNHQANISLVIVFLADLEPSQSFDHVVMDWELIVFVMFGKDLLPIGDNVKNATAATN